MQLDLGGCERVSDTALRALVKTPRPLSRLCLNGLHQLQRNTLQLLLRRHAPTLVSLGLSLLPVDAACLQELAESGAPELRHLDLSYCFHLTEEALPALAQALPALRILECRGSAVHPARAAILLDALGRHDLRQQLLAEFAAF